MDRFTVFLLFIVGISLIFGNEYNFRGVSFKTEKYPIIKLFGFIISILAIYIFFKIKKTYIKEKQEKYTKCPKCKEVFNYQELKDGKCKYCKEIDTIELEKYYKKYPKEKDDDNSK